MLTAFISPHKRFDFKVFDVHGLISVWLIEARSRTLGRVERAVEETAPGCGMFWKMFS